MIRQMSMLPGESVWRAVLARSAGDNGLPLLRACLLSGGMSRRMGTDKALLPHPAGGCWLERTLRLLLELQIPITLLSRHAAHLELARELAKRRLEDTMGSTTAPDPAACDHGMPAAPITALAEPPPWEGPLLALHRLMQHYPDERLLLCPVDMPWLNLAVLHALLAASDHAAATGTARIHLAHDGSRLQPLLGVYPSSAPIRAHLATAVTSDERRLQGWLATQPIQAVLLDPLAIRNLNRPAETQPAGSPAESPRA